MKKRYTNLILDTTRYSVTLKLASCDWFQSEIDKEATNVKEKNLQLVHASCVAKVEIVLSIKLIDLMVL